MIENKEMLEYYKEVMVDYLKKYTAGIKIYRRNMDGTFVDDCFSLYLWYLGKVEELESKNK